MRVGALDGMRVLDLGIITAGAATSAVLADLGADVIKIEAPNYPDPFRVWAGATGESPVFRATNRNKRGLSLNLKHERGRAIFQDLLEGADIVVENFRRGVLSSLNIDYPVLTARNPRIILASISSQGDDGPLAGYVSFGTTLEAMGGMAALGGYAGGTPAASGVDMNYPDQVVSLFAAGMIVTALVHRDRTGTGAHIDLSQRELTSFMCGEAFARAPEAPRLVEGADGMHALQRCFPSADGRWIAVSIMPVDEAALDSFLGARGEEALRSWASTRSGSEAAKMLRDCGFAAELVLDGQEAGALASAEGSATIHPLDDGFHAKGFAFDLREAPLAIRRDAPAAGSDTDEILAGLLGLSAADIEQLKAARVVGRDA